MAGALAAHIPKWPEQFQRHLNCFVDATVRLKEGIITGVRIICPCGASELYTDVTRFYVAAEDSANTDVFIKGCHRPQCIADVGAVGRACRMYLDNKIDMPLNEYLTKMFVCHED